ncbi:HEPN domain-containing protein [Streptomyces scabiei]|uniref:HEPN domain-containing protein n=1 Tax=Streptomyces scabiei TaxID=1930 RepID=UPI000A51AC6B|nr:HEPN domain-containing protein [Streptomyces scabiei]
MTDINGLLVAAYGEDLVRYVFNIPDAEKLDGFAARADQTVVNTLIHFALQTAHTGSLNASLTAVMNLGQYMPDEGTSLIQFLRKKSGGLIPSYDADANDPILQAFTAILSDVWPLYLIPPPKGERGTGFFMANPSAVMSHPKLAELAQCIMEDPELSKLFPDPGEGQTRPDNPLMESSEWVINVSGGGTRNLVGVVSGLLYDARLRAKIAGKKLTLDSIMFGLLQSLDALRSLASGKVVDVPVIVGFSGIFLHENEEIDFSDGILRGIRTGEHPLLLNGSGACGAIYETTFPLRIFETVKTGPGDAWNKPFKKYQARVTEALKTFQYSLEKVQLALLLSSEGDELIAPKEESRLTLDPANMGGLAQWRASDHSPSNTTLQPSKYSEVLATYNVIRKKHPESLNIAMKRLLSAASSRIDANDALIDALIAWENMFGTRQETTFRVTASLAKILESDPTDRIILQKELNKLYAVRSSMVHGAKEPDPETAEKNRYRVIRVAIDALTRLYHERPELLAMSPEDRSKTVLLEG